MKFPANTLAIANLCTFERNNASVAPIVISLGGLAGAYLLAEDKSLATLPVSGFNVGVALVAASVTFVQLVAREDSWLVLSLVFWVSQSPVWQS